MNMIAGRLGLVTALLLLGGCFSLAQRRMDQTVRTDGATAKLSIWIDSRAPMHHEPRQPVSEALASLALYPVDVVYSSLAAVTAPFDSDVAIRFGPVGAIAGIALPWITVMPEIYGPMPFHDVAIERRDFDELVLRIEAGDGVAAYRKLFGNRTRRPVSVELIELTSAPTARAAMKNGAASASKKQP